MTRPAQRRAGGFTLVEVLVAIGAMAILATLAWQGLAGVLATRDGSREAVDRTARLATVLTQWEQDLRAVVDTGAVPPLNFDGQTLRLTRRSADGVVLVAWALREGRWQRWLSPPFTTVAPLQEAWFASQQFQGREPGQLELLQGAEDWELYVFLDGNWANAQSTGDFVEVPGSGAPSADPPADPPPAPEAPASPAGTGGPAGEQPPAGGGPNQAQGQGQPPPPVVLRQQLPAAVRLVLTLDGRTLTRDVAL